MIQPQGASGLDSHSRQEVQYVFILVSTRVESHDLLQETEIARAGTAVGTKAKSHSSALQEPGIRTARAQTRIAPRTESRTAPALR